MIYPLRASFLKSDHSKMPSSNFKSEVKLLELIFERISFFLSFKFSSQQGYSGYRRRLIIRRAWVQIPAPFTGWTFICCKICILCLKKTENKHKRVQGWPFSKKGFIVCARIGRLANEDLKVAQFETTELAKMSNPRHLFLLFRLFRQSNREQMFCSLPVTSLAICRLFVRLLVIW